jgi:four helix bundle protein
MTEKTFDIKERTFEFARRILDISEMLPRSAACDIIRRQLIRSGTSVGANTEEADGAFTKADTSNKFLIALKEARETRYWLKLISEKYIDKEKIAADIEECGELVKILGSIIGKLKSQN